VLLFRARSAKDKQRVELFMELDAKYGKLKRKNSTFSQLVDAHLNPHKPEALAVGQAAPEIVGVGIDGKEMKLSDYRGKVVVLDFWGDW